MRCSAITKGGSRCKLQATHGSYCFSHAPEKAGERHRRARRGGKTGGRGRGSAELSEIQGLLVYLTNKVIRVEMSSGVAAVANQLLNTRLRAVELERRARETDELEARIERLEAGREDTERRAG